MSIAAIYDYDENRFVNFFVVKEFTPDGNVIGKFLKPDYQKKIYVFQNEETLSVDSFEYGFDLFYAGPTFGGIDYEKMPSSIIPNPMMSTYYQ